MTKPLTVVTVVIKQLYFISIIHCYFKEHAAEPYLQTRISNLETADSNHPKHPNNYKIIAKALINHITTQ